MIPITPVGATRDEAPGQIPRSHITRIIRPRVEEVLTAIKDRMQATGMMDICGRRFVLTGGASEAVLPCLQGEYRLEPDLIFTGLRVIAGV